MLRCVQKLTVLERRPTTFVSGADDVLNQACAEWHGRTLVEQHTHLHFSQRTAGCVLQHSPDLFEFHARKPLDKLVNWYVVFKILEKCRNRDPGALKNPGSTHPLGVLLNG